MRMTKYIQNHLFDWIWKSEVSYQQDERIKRRFCHCISISYFYHVFLFVSSFPAEEITIHESVLWVKILVNPSPSPHTHTHTFTPHESIIPVTFPADPSQCCLIVLMMEAASTSETSVNFYQTTRCNIPEDSRLHTRRRENLNSHDALISSAM
jgi:hypothetical protein